LNPTKTEIVEVPQPVQELWVSTLHSYPIRATTANATINDVVAFFSHAADLARVYPRHGVVRYALSGARDFPISRLGWRTFEGLVLSAASADPTTFPVALDLLQWHATRSGGTISRAALADVIEAQIARHAPLKNASEVAWAIWAALRFRVRLSESAAKEVSSLSDDVVALLALDARKARLFPAGTLDTSSWQTLVRDPDVLRTDHWLLGYESEGHGWLRGAAAAIQADPFFRELKRASVHFYSRRRPYLPFTGPAAPLPGGALPTWSV
jgi:hypothetical protein